MALLPHSLLRFYRDQTGLAAIETAVFAGIMLAMLVPLANLSQVIRTTLRLDNALRITTHYAFNNSISGCNVGSLDSNLRKVLIRSAGLPAGTPNSAYTATTNIFECDGVVMANCNDTCGGTKAVYSRVGVSYQQPLTFDYPGIGSQYPINRQIIVRTQ